MLNSSPLFNRARQGRIPPSVVHSYLRSLHYLISHTQPHLRVARERAIACGQFELAAFFEEKQRDEAGHEEWAESDMRRLAHCFGDLGPVSPAPSIVALCRFIERLIGEDPRLYVVYMLSAEYFTVLLGPVWVEALTTGCGVPVAALTVVSKHVEADAEHSREGFLAIERFAAAPGLQERVLDAVNATFKYFAQLPEDLLRLCDATAVSFAKPVAASP
jgi:hypothetical protein